MAQRSSRNSGGARSRPSLAIKLPPSPAAPSAKGGQAASVRDPAIPQSVAVPFAHSSSISVANAHPAAAVFMLPLKKLAFRAPSGQQ